MKRVDRNRTRRHRYQSIKNGWLSISRPQIEEHRMSPTRRRFVGPWLVLPLVLVVGVGSWLVFRPGKSSAQATTPSQQTVEVTKGTMDQTVASSGTIAPTDTENLTFSSAGTVTSVHVKAGEVVAKGALLATIDAANLQAAVASAQATVDSAAAKLDSDQTAGASAAQVTADQASLTSANTQLSSAQVALLGSSLISPIAGTVSSVDLTVGQQLGSGGTSGTGVTGTGTGSGLSSSTLGSASSGSSGGSPASGSSASTGSGAISVISTNSYTIPLSIDATQIQEIKVGQKASVTPTTSAGATGNGRGGFGGFGGFGGGGAAGRTGTGQSAGGSGQTAATSSTPAASAVTGTVSSVSAVASASSGVATFPVEVTVSGDTTGFYAGATAQVQIVYRELTNVVQVPSGAITTTDSGSTVIVEANGKQQTQTVTTGISAGGMTQITSELKAGESVVITLPTGFGGRAGAGLPGAATSGATRTGQGANRQQGQGG